MKRHHEGGRGLRIILYKLGLERMTLLCIRPLCLGVTLDPFLHIFLGVTQHEIHAPNQQFVDLRTEHERYFVLQSCQSILIFF